MFRLTKWYLDLVTDDGAAFIGYALRLRWNRLAVSYASTLLSLPDAPTRERFTLRRTPRPVLGEDGSVAWTCGPLGVDGRWAPRLPPVRRRLYSGPGSGEGSGTLDWECVAPAADARLRLGPRELAGTGYAERLRLTLPPWRLPLDELLWGRFLGARSSVVWIEWRGEAPRRVVLVDGRDASDGAVIDPAGVALPGTRLDLQRDGSRSLRDGPLADVFAAVPALARLVPGRLGRARESKWLSRARLSRSDTTPADTGWAIHEVVTWPAPMKV